MRLQTGKARLPRDCRKTSHPLSITFVSFMEPIQFFGPASGDGGTISATGLPKRVTLTGLFVWRTCSSRARHLAFEAQHGHVLPRRHLPDYFGPAGAAGTRFDAAHSVLEKLRRLATMGRRRHRVRDNDSDHAITTMNIEYPA
jgi:hypothetical protein